MKTLKTLSTLVLAAGLIFTSCKKKDSTPDPTNPVSSDPSISWISNSSTSTGWTSADATVTVGSPIQIGYNASANATTTTKLDSIFLTVIRTDVTPNILISALSTSTTVPNSPASTATGSLSIPAGVITTPGIYNVTYKIHDKNAYTSSVSLNITVVPNIGTAGGGSATAGGAASTTGSYINLENAIVYTQSQAITPAYTSSVELVYSDAKLFSPKDALETNATIKAGGQTTLLQKYTGSASFSNLTALDVAASSPSATNATVAAGDIYFYSTNGKKGVFQVASLTASTGSTDATTITIKIQQ